MTDQEEVYRSPPFDLEGYTAYKVKYRSGDQATVLEHREVMEKYLKRSLGTHEVVHHKDGNKKNNDIDNLEIMSRSQHGKLHKPTEMYEFTCPWCGGIGRQKARDVKRNRNKGCAGPFCSRSCAGKWSMSDEAP